MEKVKHTIENILEFSQIAIEHVNTNKEDSKLKYALIKFIGDPASRNKGTLYPIIKDYQNKVTHTHIELAATDEKTGILLKDMKGNYEYTKDNRKELIKQLDDLMNLEYEVEPYYATEVDTEKLTDFEKRTFQGFVIK